MPQIRDIKKVLACRAMIRQLQEVLGNEVEVSHARRYHDRIRVSFRDGTTENWATEKQYSAPTRFLLPLDPYEGFAVPIRHQYDFSPLDDNAEQMKRLFLISHKQWRTGSFYEQRLSIHRLIYRILQEGWVDIEYHPNDLKKDLISLDVNLHDKHTWDGMLHLYGQYGSKFHPGSMLLEQFTNYASGKIKKAWFLPMVLFYTIRILLKKKKDVTRHNMLCVLRRQTSIRQVCPNVYRAMLRHFGLNGCVIADPYPGFGSKAIAAAMEECQYHSSEPFDRLGGYLGTEYYGLDRDNYDAVLLDYDFTQGRWISDLRQWSDKADVKLVFVPRKIATKFPKPDRYIEIKTGMEFENKTDFVFYYV